MYVSNISCNLLLAWSMSPKSFCIGKEKKKSIVKMKCASNRVAFLASSKENEVF